MFNNITVLTGFFLAHIQKVTQATDNYCIFSVKVFCGLFLFANFPAFPYFVFCAYHNLVSGSNFHCSMFGTVEL